MNWTTPADIRRQLERLWNKGGLPEALVTRAEVFPLPLSLRTPGSSDIVLHLSAVMTWAETLKTMKHVKLTYQKVKNQVQGPQTLPQKASIETLDDALILLGKKEDVQQIMALHAMTLEKAPFLQDWFSKNTLKALQHATVWEQLLTLTIWMRDNPAPDIYLRQVDLPGIHTKFIERHRTILSLLFQEALPAHAINPACSGIDKFEQRYGFRTKPLRVRFRVLDAALSPIPGNLYPDITLDSASFAALALIGVRIFIVENESSFLSFPQLFNTLVIFGSGYCWDSLKSALWLQNCTIFYWGDIDTHGFRILDHLRAILPLTRSFLMDEPTLLAYRSFWDKEASPVRHPLTRLTPSEQQVLTALQTDLFERNLRLEQERIHLSDLHAALDQLSRV
nr:Wadjet anti-phage system protein JetD domain-containing protein [Acetobacter persici]